MAGQVDAAALLNAPPTTDGVSDYDLAHAKQYLRLLDADREGADWREAASIVLGLDPEAEPERARHVHAAHLDRARWMTRHGYKHLLVRPERR